MEMAWASNDEIMAHGEGVVRHIARTLLDEREDELTFLDVILINSHAMQIQHILGCDMMKRLKFYNPKT